MSGLATILLVSQITTRDIFLWSMHTLRFRAEAEINEFGVMIFVQQQVLRLQIAMSVTSFVEVTEAFGRTMAICLGVPQPRSQGISSSRPLEQARRDPGKSLFF